MLRKSSTAIIIALVFMVVASCDDDPPSPFIPPDDSVSWPDMTSRDDVIKTVVLTYQKRKDGEALSRYNALLHTQYFFGFAPADVQPGDPPIMTRGQDIVSTEFLFDPSMTSVLELVIVPEEGSWYEYPELEGEPCENCYGTERQYFIRVRFGEGTTIYQSPIGSAFVVIIVAPDETDTSKWVVRAIYDIVR